MFMDYETFEKYCQTCTAIPVSRRMLADVMTPVSVFLSIREGAEYPFLLESVEGGEQLARYTFLGSNPYQVLIFDGSDSWMRRNGENRRVERPYFELLRELTAPHREPDLPDLPRLTGGAVGFSSYDTVRELEKLGETPPSDLALPEAVWAFYDQIIAFDHVKKQLVLIKTVFVGPETDPAAAWQEAQRSLDEMEETLQRRPQTDPEFHLEREAFSSNIDRNRFMEMVESGKHYIREGDIFQVVLSQRFQVPFRGDRFMLYRALRMVNPSPYLFYLEFDGFSLVGSSPEVLVQVQKGKVRLLPIAGTRSRGKTPQEDLALEEELRNDPKEIAEHIMLVDLGRNDLARVCRPGTVEVRRDRFIERFSHVMHMVSDVTGELDEGMGPVDALMHCFPAGTVSGAPKIRAMQIIDELEPTRRGPYAGAVGYFDFSGDMDTCIAIRTMVVTDDRVYIQAGAGVVADSRPEREFEETREKAGALVEALSVALEIRGDRASSGFINTESA